jgi:UDPglucose--hexose-1-phosphate uridylyltransferase
MPEVRVDPLTGLKSIVTPERATRPGGGLSAEPCPPIDPETDPFREGHEDQTPPEVFALRPNGSAPDTPGWTVRVVPNLYPALERQEVVIHGPEHVHSIGELRDSTLDLVAEAWQRRARDTGGICFPLINEGREAGASLPHSHSQLAWLPAPAPNAASERGLPELVDLLHHDGLVAGCPVASRVPYELLIAPDADGGDWRTSDDLGSALRLLAELVRRLQRLRNEELVPFNAWLHDRPRWHLEVLPRTTRLAGLELGAGVYINPLAPEQASSELSAA